jgi:nitrate/TMAO reductase-like tetraheme cytochrome c subunit
MASEPQGGIIRRTWTRLTRPSARWSVLALLVTGAVVGFVATAGTQVMVEVTGTDAFCGTTCHSMQWVAKEHATSVHAVNHAGVKAGCHDCHIPKHYPELLWYKAKAGTKDIVGEIAGVISTEEKFKKERKRMAEHVWEEYKANDSQSCRNCHKFDAEIVKKQKEFVQPMHQQVLEGKATCIDCHKGIAHTAPD